MNEVLVNSSAQVASLLSAKSTIEVIIGNLNLILSENISSSNAIDEIILKIKNQNSDIYQKESYVVLVKKLDELIKSIESVSQDINIKIISLKKISDITSNNNISKNEDQTESIID